MAQLSRHFEMRGTSCRAAEALRSSIAVIGISLAALAMIAFSAAAFASPAPKPQTSPMVLRGTLGALSSNPILKVGGKNYVLKGQSSYLLRTLEDKRLLNQELQLVGTTGPDGSFVVQKLYAVKNGELYHIQYYCEVCNITYVQPGHCYCCGRETELQEIPVGPAN